jgi:hypothetical protein
MQEKKKVKLQVLAKGLQVQEKTPSLTGSVTQLGCGGHGVCLVVSPDMD